MKPSVLYRPVPFASGPVRSGLGRVMMVTLSWLLILVALTQSFLVLGGCSRGARAARPDWYVETLQRLQSIPVSPSPPLQPPVVARAPTVDRSFPPVSVDAVGVPASEVLADIAQQAGVSVVVPDASPAVTLRMSMVSMSDAFAAVARAAAFTTTTSPAGVWQFTPRGDAPEAITILPPSHVPAVELAEAIRAACTKAAVVKTIAGRVVVAGSAEDVQRAAVVLSDVAVAGPRVWLVSVDVYSVTRAFQREVGIDLSLSAGGRVRGGVGVGNLPSEFVPVLGARATAVADILAYASQSDDDARVLTSATTYILEGTKVDVTDGVVVPVPQRTVSAEGTVTVTGYADVRTGFSLGIESVAVPSGLRLQVEPRISDIQGFVDERPITAERTITASVVLQDGQTVLLSSVDVSRASDRLSGLPWLRGTGSRASADRRTVIIAIRATRASESTSGGAKGVGVGGEAAAPSAAGEGGGGNWNRSGPDPALPEASPYADRGGSGGASPRD